MTERYLDRLKSGERLSPQELDEIRSSLATRTPDSDVYDLLRALAASSRPTDADVQVAEEILREGKDPYAVKGAIWALCHHWGLTASYAADLLEIAQPDNWDAMSDAGIPALSELGSYLWQEQDKGVYRALLHMLEKDRTLEETGSKDFWPVHLECVVAALDQGLRGSDASVHSAPIRSFKDLPTEFLRQVELKARLH